jgi:hypothetical protein
MKQHFTWSEQLAQEVFYKLREGGFLIGVIESITEKPIQKKEGFKNKKRIILEPQDYEPNPYQIVVDLMDEGMGLGKKHNVEWRVLKVSLVKKKGEPEEPIKVPFKWDCEKLIKEAEGSLKRVVALTGISRLMSFDTE